MTKQNQTESMNKTDTIDKAQTDMRKSYADGSIGILVSGTIWLISAIVTAQLSAKHGIWALIIGGMFIFPLSIVVGKLFRLSGTHQKGNPLGSLAMESTIFMLMCLPLAYGLSFEHSEWFFQGMLMIIGGRYLSFASIYGTKLYWILGAVIGIAAFLLFSVKAQSFISALTGSIIEIFFGLFMFIRFRKANN
jgi:hypothetical protein